jgi:hypothetical protein
MRNKVVLSFLLLCIAAGLTWAQFWKGYSDTERKSIAEAYWLAGTQYQTVGQAEKGSEFRALAKIIYPSLDPSAIKDQELPSAAELLAQGRAAAIGAGAQTVPTVGLNSFFLRFVGAMLDEKSDEVLPFLDGSIYLTKEKAPLAQQDAKTELDAFFEKAPLEGKTPSDVYDLNSVTVAAVPQSMQAVWGESYTLGVTAHEDYSSLMSFWEPKQQYYIHRTTDGWRIFAIGPGAPPLSWSPQKAPVEKAAAPAAAPEDPSPAITDAFKTWMGGLLSKDAEASVAGVADNIRFLRLRQTVSRDELRTSLEGYFEKADIPSSMISDTIDLASVFVAPAQSPVEGVEGPVYVLNAKSTVDLSDSIPFWAGYMQFYYVVEKGVWVVFAIM